MPNHTRMSAAPAFTSSVHRWIAAQAGWRGHVLSLAAGALATLGHAPFFLVPVFAASLIFLLWQIDVASQSARPSRMSFARGFWFGLGHFSTSLYWVYFAFQVDAETFAALAVPAVIGLAGLLAVFWAIALAIAVRFWTRGWRRVTLFAAAVGLAEFGRGTLFGGLPWNLTGYVWRAGEPVSQLAASVGIYGLSFLTVFALAAPATLADSARSAAVRFAPTLIAALAVGLAWGAGVHRIAQAPEAGPDPATGEMVIVRVADSGLNEAEKWEPSAPGLRDQDWRVFRLFAAVSGDPRESRANVVIWPEGALPYVDDMLLDNQPLLDAIGAMLGDRALITGLTRCEPAEDCRAYMHGRRGPQGLRVYNSSVVIDGVSGAPRVAQTSDKHRLVPFGEFIPLWSLVEGFNFAPLQRIGAGFTPGPPPSRIVVPDAPPAVVLICYEAIFPGLTPRGADRPGWLVSVTNDAWFGNGTGPQQHYNMARYRSIEEGLPMARAASGGISAIIDSMGRPVRETGADAYAAEAGLPPALSDTVYARWGHLLTPLVFFLILGLRWAPGQTDRKGSKV